MTVPAANLAEGLPFLTAERQQRGFFNIAANTWKPLPGLHNHSPYFAPR